MLKRYWIPDHLHNPITLTMVVAVFGVSNAFRHESGLLAVTLMGFVAANQASVSVRHILVFKENLRVLLISGLFLLLASRLSLDDLRTLDPGAFLFLAALVLLVRPLAVLASTAGTDLTRAERIFLAWLCPRGIVAAAVASVFALGLDPVTHPGAERLVPLTFLVIVGTVVVYGLTSGWIARRLGLALPRPQGVLFVGAHAGARDVAAALQAEGVPVVLVDANRRNVAAARMAHLPARVGNALDDDFLERLDLAEIGRVLAMTPNDEVNSLVAVHHVHDFGRSEVYQLARETVQTKGGGAASPELRGRTLFAADADYYHLSGRFARGRVKTTKLTDQFDFDAFREQHGERSLPLFSIGANGTLTVATAEQPLAPRPGDKVVAVVEPAPEEPSEPEAETEP
jgi:hypothetical protein